MGRGWFVILIICRYGDMLLVVWILEIFPGNVWFWCIRVSRLPRGLLYGWPYVCWVWVGVFMLLNIILYCGNNLCRYLVDLDAVSLVSWMAIMDGGEGLFVNDWSPGRAVFSVPQFHEIILVSGFVCRV
jgi:hypothetical protein